MTQLPVYLGHGMSCRLHGLDVAVGGLHLLLRHLMDKLFIGRAPGRADEELAFCVMVIHIVQDLPYTVACHPGHGAGLLTGGHLPDGGKSLVKKTHHCPGVGPCQSVKESLLCGVIPVKCPGCDPRLLHDPAKGSPLKALFQEFLPGRLKDPLLCSLLFFHGLPPLCILPLPAGNSLRCCGPFHIGPSGRDNSVC